MLYDFDVCYVATHGFSIRMLTQTNLLRRLAQKGLRVCLIVPDASDESVAELRNGDEVTVFSSGAKLSTLQVQWTGVRKYVLQDYTHNPALLEKYELEVSSRSRLPVRLRARSGKILGKFVQNSTRLRSWIRRREVAWLSDQSIDATLASINPQLLVVTYPMMPPEAQYLIAAGKQGRTSIIHLLSWDNITSKGVFPAIANRYISWGPIMTAELEEYYEVPPAAVTECGVPHFDKHADYRDSPASAAELAEAFGLRLGIPIVLVTMSAPRFAPYEIEIVEHLAHIAADSPAPPFQLLVRPHPQNVTGIYFEQGLKTRLDAVNLLPNCIVNFPNVVEDSALTWAMKQDDMRYLCLGMKYCTVALNSGSTTAIEALYYEKPVVITAFDGTRDLPYWESARRLIDFTHLRKFIELGGATVATSLPELVAAIGRLSRPTQDDAAQRRRALLAEVADIEGRATERVIDSLRSALS